MAEVLMNSISRTHFCCCHSLHLHCHSDIKTNRKHVKEVYPKNMVSKIDKGHLSYGNGGKDFIGGFTKKTNNFVAVSDIVATDESEMVYEEEEEFDFDNHLLKYEVPPWGNVPFQRDLAMDNRYISQLSTNDKRIKVIEGPRTYAQNESHLPEMVSHTPLAHVTTSATGGQTLQETVSVYEHKVHFLEERDEKVLSTRILKLSQNNKVTSALQLFRSMEVSGLNPNPHACNSLLSCLLRKKSLDDALKVFQFMKAKGITTGHSYSLILKAIANAQGFDSAMNLFTELEGDHRQKKSFDIIVYNTMISICAKVGNWVYIEKIWRRSINENDIIGTSITYRLLISVFARFGQVELAIDAYNEMVENEVEPGEDSMHALIGACSKDGKWELALHVFQDMLNGGLKPNLIACNALINTLGKAGKIKPALKVYKTMKSLGHTPDTFTWNALLGAFYKSNRHFDALQLFETISKENGVQMNVHLYDTALMSCQKLRLWEKAIQLLWKMEASELPVSVSSYNLVIGACEAARKPRVALQVYQHMVQQNCVPDTFTHLSLIRACVWGSLWEEVDEILTRVEPNASIYNTVIQGMCLKAKNGAAKKLYMKMRKIDLEPDGKTRALMLQHLPRDY